MEKYGIIKVTKNICKKKGGITMGLIVGIVILILYYALVSALPVVLQIIVVGLSLIAAGAYIVRLIKEGGTSMAILVGLIFVGGPLFFIKVLEPVLIKISYWLIMP